jgi:hypothetical protein
MTTVLYAIVTIETLLFIEETSPHYQKGDVGNDVVIAAAFLSLVWPIFWLIYMLNMICKRMEK